MDFWSPSKLCELNPIPTWMPGVGTPILGHGREVPRWLPCLWVFQSDALCYSYVQSDWPALSAEKIGLSLSHLISEILGHKVGLIFTKMYYLTDFKYFVSISALIFDPLDHLFYWF